MESIAVICAAEGMYLRGVLPRQLELDSRSSRSIQPYIYRRKVQETEEPVTLTEGSQTVSCVVCTCMPFSAFPHQWLQDTRACCVSKHTFRNAHRFKSCDIESGLSFLSAKIPHTDEYNGIELYPVSSLAFSLGLLINLLPPFFRSTVILKGELHVARADSELDC